MTDSLPAILTIGFLLGARHATDADHVVAVSAIVARERTLRAAAPLGLLWGVGHTLTILLVGGAMVLLGLVIPPHLGLGMEFSVSIMLVLLGGMTLLTSVRRLDSDATDHHHSARGRGPLGALLIGTVHGLAGSAAISLLVLGVIHDSAQAVLYLFVFGLGTIAGMLLITSAMALPIAAAARHFRRFHVGLGICAGMTSMAFGAFLAYRIGVVDGLFSATPDWSPR